MSTPLLYAGLSGGWSGNALAASGLEAPNPAVSLLGRSEAGVKSSLNNWRCVC